MNELLDLFLTFAKMGVMTFGGGMAMLPILQREVVDTKHWAISFTAAFKVPPVAIRSSIKRMFCPFSTSAV